jgi:predicted N-acetyltransferase YhbS
MEAIRYETNGALSVEDFKGILERSTLGARRPIGDPDAMKGMVENANLIVCAWMGKVLVGVARSVTDFSFCCYLSDLAVDIRFQKMGIGKNLIRRTQESLGKNCKLILLSAPAAVEYYPKIGFERHNQAFWIDATGPIA